MAPDYPRIMQTVAPGPGTCPGPGDIVIDNRGKRYRIVSDGEADMIRNSTAGVVYTIHPDGTVR